MSETGRPAVMAILAELRRALKQRGLKARELAARFGVAEPTMWRWLRGQGLTLDRLDRLCQMAGLELRELMAAPGEEGAEHFTFAQERVLAADRALGLLFFAILNGAQRETLRRDFGLDPAVIEGHIERLRRLALIDTAASGKLRPLVSRAVKWRAGGPLAAAFERTIKQFFFAFDFGAPDTRYVSDMVYVSEASRARIHAMFEALRDDIHVIAAQDAKVPHGRYEWSGILMLVNPLSITDVTSGLR